MWRSASTPHVSQSQPLHPILLSISPPEAPNAKSPHPRPSVTPQPQPQPQQPQPDPTPMQTQRQGSKCTSQKGQRGQRVRDGPAGSSGLGSLHVGGWSRAHWGLIETELAAGALYHIAPHHIVSHLILWKLLLSLSLKWHRIPSRVLDLTSHLTCHTQQRADANAVRVLHSIHSPN